MHQCQQITGSEGSVHGSERVEISLIVHCGLLGVWSPGVNFLPTKRATAALLRSSRFPLSLDWVVCMCVRSLKSKERKRALDIEVWGCPGMSRDLERGGLCPWIGLEQED